MKKTSLLIILYQILTVLSLPIIFLYLEYRKSLGKEDRLRFKERFGFATKTRPQGFLLWIHAASVGEVLSILPLMDRILAKHKDCNILLTTGTVNSAKITEGKLSSKVIHQFIPIDNLLTVNKFLKTWKPNLAVWVESEIWPCTVNQAAKVCDIILINASLSQQSFRNWQYCRPLIENLLNKFTAILGQSHIDVDYFKKLGATNVAYTGNIKYDASSLPADPEQLEKLAKAIGERQVWVAASTHNDEEVKIANVHRKLKSTYPDLLTIIVPRHPDRSDQIIKDIGSDLNIVKRSSNAKIAKKTDIYIADTLGELGIFYRLTKIAFVGGTLAPIGGHNPLEPARLGCAVLYGPHMENFVEIDSEFLTRDAAIKVFNEDNLKQVLEDLFSHKNKVAKLIKAGEKLVKDKSGVLDLVLSYIEPYIIKYID